MIIIIFNILETLAWNIQSKCQTEDKSIFFTQVRFWWHWIGWFMKCHPCYCMTEKGSTFVNKFITLLHFVKIMIHCWSFIFFKIEKKTGKTLKLFASSEDSKCFPLEVLYFFGILFFYVIGTQQCWLFIELFPHEERITVNDKTCNICSWIFSIGGIQKFPLNNIETLQLMIYLLPRSLCPPCISSMLCGFWVKWINNVHNWKGL